MIHTTPEDFSEQYIKELDLNLIPIVSEYYIENYEENLNNYFELWKYSNYRFKIKPIRNIINKDKEIIGILIENGETITINPSKIFKIYKRKGSNYLIESLVDNEFNTYIDEIKPKLYESYFIDDRIRYLKELDYKQKVYQEIKNIISNFLQLSENFSIKQWLRENINEIGIPISIKELSYYLLLINYLILLPKMKK